MKCSRQEARSVFAGDSKDRSVIIALLIFTPSFVIYWISFFGVLHFDDSYLKVVCSFINGIAIALLFIIGHDACHDNFTPFRWLNHFLGRLAFLPSFYPFTSWEQGHNRLHHSWTNLRGRDYAWAPLSFEEFSSLSTVDKLLTRFGRNPIGIGTYTFRCIWWEHMMRPSPDEVARMPRWRCLGDRLLVLAFILAQVLTLLGFSSGSAAMSLVSGFVVPQLIFLWLFGVVTYLQHTHPKARWFDEPDEWCFYTGQVENTVHLIFPKPIGWFLHHVGEHTAHHVDPRIPLYRLKTAQSALKQKHDGDVIESKFSLPALLRIMRTCQLYDYREHRWLDFEGNPTT